MQLLFHHIDQCETCGHVDRGMCLDGEKLLKQAGTHTAEAMAPMPRENGKA